LLNKPQRKKSIVAEYGKSKSIIVEDYCIVEVPI
jgi:hypothetical protein